MKKVNFGKTTQRHVDEKVLVANGVAIDIKWNKIVPRKVDVFVWRLCQGRLLVRTVLEWALTWTQFYVRIVKT